MGMYTEVYFNADLVADIPEYDIENIKDSIHGNLKTASRPLCQDMSFYTPCTKAFYMEPRGYSGGAYSLLFKGDLKNYNSEFQRFLEFITPYVETYGKTFVGYMRYEEEIEPTLVYIEDSKVIYGTTKED